MTVVQDFKIFVGLSLVCITLFGYDASARGVNAGVSNWVAKVSPLRLKVQGDVNVYPYRDAQQQDFRNYFVEIEDLAVRLAQDSRFAGSFSYSLSWMDLADFCSKSLVKRSDWQIIVSNCTKNGLFLCSDEVKFYPEMTAGIRKFLAPDQQRRFDAAAACASAL